MAFFIIHPMKTPQHWCTSSIYFLVVLPYWRYLTSWRHFQCNVTWHHDVLLWRHMTSWHHIRIFCKVTQIRISMQNWWKITISNLVTLPFEFFWDIVQLYRDTNFVSVCQTIWPGEGRQTDGLTDGTDSITSTTDTGGNKVVLLLNIHKAFSLRKPPIEDNFQQFPL